jgi:methylase of polypeptide subunit release factors
LEDRVEQINTSLLNSLPLSGERGYNLVITANLPYIKNGDLKNIDDETMEFEPDLALY